jgi:hypothetical protein
MGGPSQVWKDPQVAPSEQSESSSQQSLTKGTGLVQVRYREDGIEMDSVSPA